MVGSLHWKGGRPGNLLSMMSFSCFTVQYDRPSLSTTFKGKLVMSESGQIEGMRTSPIASKSVIADDVAPRIFAQCATCQSY